MNNNSIKKTVKKPKKQRNKGKKGKKPGPGRNLLRQRKMPKIKGFGVLPKGPGKQVVKIKKENGTVDVYTKRELQQIKASGVTLPENYVDLLPPNVINISNAVPGALGTNPGATGIPLNLEVLIDCIIANAVARAPHLPPPAISYLKFYCFWCVIERFRNEKLQGLFSATGTNQAQFSKAVIPDFDEGSFAIPTALAVFIEHFMPWTDPVTGTSFKYSISWEDLWVENGGVMPAITGPSLQNNALEPSIFNRSSIGNSILTEVLPASMLATSTNEMTYGLNPSGAVFSVAGAYAAGVAISAYWKQIGTYATLKQIPFTARDGTAYAYVSSAVSTFPGIYSNASFFDSEYAFMFHQPTNPAANLSSAQTFRKIEPLPTVLFDTYPNAAAPAFPTGTPAQIGMICNFAYIANMCTYHPLKSRINFLKTCWNLYGKLTSFQPNFFILDLNGFHYLVEAHASQIQQITFNSSSQVNSATGEPTPGGSALSVFSDLVSFLITCESALLAHVMKFSWAGLVFYSNSDIASGTAIAGNFKNVVLPPLIADYISGIGPCVMDGKLYTPLLYWGPAPTIEAGSTFRGLNASYDYASSRWLNMINPVGSATIGVGVYPTMYTPATADSTSVVPPDSTDREGPFAYSLAWPALPQANTWNLNLAGGVPFVVNQASMLPLVGVVQSTPDLIVGATSRYAPVTPNRYSKQIIKSYTSFVNKVSQTFILPDDHYIGTLSQLSVVVTQTPFLNALSIAVRNQSASGSVAIPIFMTIDYMVEEVGAQLPLDQASLGNVIEKAYRTAANVYQMPFIYTAAADTSVWDGMIMDTIRAPGQENTFMIEYGAVKQQMHGSSPIAALRTVLVPYFKALAPFANPLHKGAAALKVIRALKNITVAPFTNSNTDLSVFNSPSGMEDALSVAIGGVPVLGGLVTAGRDLFHLIFG